MRIIRSSAFSSLPAVILLDLDNTLYEYAPANQAAMGAVTSVVVESLALSKEEFEAAFLQARSETKSFLGPTASSHSRLLYFQRTLENLGLGPQPFLSLDMEQIYWSKFLRTAKLFDGARRFLSLSRLLGIKTALVTNLTAQIQMRKIVTFGLESSIDCLVSSEEVGVDKPNAKCFETALEKVSHQTGAVWMIGDSIKDDIAGARESIRAVTVQKLHKGVERGTGANRADAEFADFHNLSEFLESLGRFE